MTAQEGCRNEQHNEEREGPRQLNLRQISRSSGKSTVGRAIAAELGVRERALGAFDPVIVRKVRDAVQDQRDGQHRQQCSHRRVVPSEAPR